MNHSKRGYKKSTLFIPLLLCLILQPASNAAAQDNLLEFKVRSIEPQTWIVTAVEVSSGEEMKFFMPSATFKGLTFEASLDQIRPGQRFSVQGPKNSRLDMMQPGERRDRQKMSQYKSLRQQRPAPGPALSWEIINVNSKEWIVTARNQRLQKTAKFRVDPETFAGFRFFASLEDIRKGKGFSILTPNDEPMNNCAVFIEFVK